MFFGAVLIGSLRLLHESSGCNTCRVVLCRLLNCELKSGEGVAVGRLVAKRLDAMKVGFKRLVAKEAKNSDDGCKEGGV